MAGSDDGSIYFWDRNTTNNVRILRGDNSIVNCLQPHPSCCLLATSGIDPVVRLWSPQPEVIIYVYLILLISQFFFLRYSNYKKMPFLLVFAESYIIVYKTWHN